MSNKAVVLGANYYIGLSIIRCLGIHNVKVVAIDYSENESYALKSKYVSEQIIAPHYKNDSKAFLDFLISYAKKQSKKPVLFPSADPYVEFIDNNFDVLKEYYLISQTEKGLFTKVMDKATLAELAKKYNMKIPETVSIGEVDFEEKVNTIIKFPCLVKPVDSPKFVSIFRKKLFKVYNFSELMNKIELAQNEGCDVIVQRIIEGFDDHMYTFDAHLNQDSKVTHWLTCQKYRQYPINYGASVYTTQKYVKELFDKGAVFLENIKWKGFAEIEFKKDVHTNEYYLIEINVRTTNLNSLIFKCGINMPYITYRELIGKEIGNQAITKDLNIVFWYAYEDLLAIKDYIKTKQLKIGQVIMSYFKRKAYAIWDINDIVPFFSFIKYKILRPIKLKITKG